MHFLSTLAQQQGISKPLFCLMAGPCVIESEQLALDTAGYLAELAATLHIPFIYKSSFDKANRSAGSSYRGLGIAAGLQILAAVKQQIKVPVMTDVHEVSHIAEVAAVVDVLQTPAFLCRQTNFIQEVAQQGLPVNIKKGQFLSPAEMRHVVTKATATGNHHIMLCERGTCFGYNNLVVDMRSLAIMRQFAYPVIFDATHAVQQPGSLATASGGEREYIPVLARAAIAAGIDGIFMETHPQPHQAKSDAAVMWPLTLMKPLLQCLVELAAITTAHDHDFDLSAYNKPAC